MNMKGAFLIFALALILPGVFCAGECPAKGAADNSLYAELLKRYVKDGLVDYSGLKKDEEVLDRYLMVLEEVRPEALLKESRFAFYVNAYNAWTIKLILTGYPGVESIKELGSFLRSPWKKKICRIDGGLKSLDEIEHEILRKHFNDPRVHFAINCASRSCPPLRGEPYEGEILEAQLDDATRSFINDPEMNRIEGDTLHVSKIFDWFKEDFNDDIPRFFLPYAEGDLKKALDEGRNRIRVKYLDYDWSLNGS